MSANLVGFAIGIDGMKYMMQQLFSSWQGVFLQFPTSDHINMFIGIRFLLAACVCLFAAVQLMFEYRYVAQSIPIYYG